MSGHNQGVGGLVLLFIPMPAAFDISIPDTEPGDGLEEGSKGHAGPALRDNTVRGGGEKAMKQGRLEGLWTPKRGVKRDFLQEVSAASMGSQMRIQERRSLLVSCQFPPLQGNS